MGWRSIIFGLAVLTACEDATGPYDPEVRNAILVKDVDEVTWLHSVWNDMQRCSGLTGSIPFVKISFYSVPGPFFQYDTLDVIGLWDGARRQIYISHLETNPVWTVKHEIMHALLYPIHGHPPEWFVTGPCGDLITGTPNGSSP